MFPMISFRRFKNTNALPDLEIHFDVGILYLSCFSKFQIPNWTNKDTKLYRRWLFNLLEISCYLIILFLYIELHKIIEFNWIRK